MDSFVEFMRLILDFMRRDYNFYGFSFSFFDVFMFSILGSLVSLLISGLISGGD